MLTVAQSSKLLGVSPARVRALISSGALGGVKRGNAWFVDERDVVARIQNRPKSGRPGKAVEASSATETHGLDPAKLQAIAHLYEKSQLYLSHQLTADEAADFESPEMLRFATAITDFFLREKQMELVKAGAF